MSILKNKIITRSYWSICTNQYEQWNQCVMIYVRWRITHLCVGSFVLHERRLKARDLSWDNFLILLQIEMWFWWSVTLWERIVIFEKDFAGMNSHCDLLYIVFTRKLGLTIFVHTYIIHKLRYITRDILYTWFLLQCSIDSYYGDIYHGACENHHKTCNNSSWSPWGMKQDPWYYSRNQW